MRRRRKKRRKNRKRLAYAVMGVAFILAGFLAYSSLHSSNKTASSEAAIIDQLSSLHGQSNQTFVDASINILERGGLTWAYYNGTEVTVDFYRKLPSYGTTLIILRVHSAIMRVEGGTTIPILGLFTSERYSPEAAQNYPVDVNDQRLVEAYFSEEDRAQGISYFGIVPKFVEKSMKGRFKDTIIIMMGCEGLTKTVTGMAEAFIGKGAKVYISWNGTVGIDHTDHATVHLLRHLISEKQNIRKAVEKTMEDVGPDPDYKSVLKYYPDETGNYTIPNLKSSLTMNVAYTALRPKTPTKSKHMAHG